MLDMTHFNPQMLNSNTSTLMYMTFAGQSNKCYNDNILSYIKPVRKIKFKSKRRIKAFYKNSIKKLFVEYYGNFDKKYFKLIYEQVKDNFDYNLSNEKIDAKIKNILYNLIVEKYKNC